MEENLKVLESLPTEEEFLKSLNEKEPKSILPYLNRIHKIIHHILPKPNQGLWEPGLNLNPFILSYFAFIYEKYEKDFEKNEKNLNKEEEQMEEIL
eukprot:gene1492-12109_t